MVVSREKKKGLDYRTLDPVYRSEIELTVDETEMKLTTAVQIITKIYLYNFDPLKPHFCTVKLGFTGIYIIVLISAQKHRL